MLLKDRVAIVTGGASGIGFGTAKRFLQEGAKVAICDVRQDAIDQAVEQLKEFGPVKGYVTDISDRAQCDALAKAVAEEFGGRIDILINNAGIITSNKTFAEVGFDEIDRTMLINALAPMYVTRVMLPDMLRRGVGHICNITSAGGMLGNPRMAVYGASKWAAIGWSDSVRIELQEQKSPVRVTTVTPYYINTGMFDGVKSPIIPVLKPEYVAKRVIRAIEKNLMFRGIPFGLHFIRFWQFVLPIPVFDFIFGKVFGIYHTMDNFTGRK